MSEPERGHVAALDGLRGIAIALVLVHHCLLAPALAAPRFVHDFVEAGWCGVDVFFAISGFLITGILIRSRGRPHFWRTFYVRRALRILPLFWLVSTLLVLTQSGVHEPPAFVRYTFLYNLWIARLPGFPEDGRIDVSWSLCVEEHFYLVWPFLVRWLPDRRAALALGAVVIVAIASRLFFFSRGELVAVYALTPCRIDALALGAAAAFVWQDRDERLIRFATRAAAPLAVLALVLLFAGGFDRRAMSFVTAGYLLVPAATACAILAFVAGRAPGAARLLGARPLVLLGRISFGVYLLHPLGPQAIAFAAASLGLDPMRAASSLGGGLAAIGVSIAIATLTWRTIESPLLRLKDRLTPKTQAV